MAKCKDCIHYDLCLSHPTLSYSCLDVKEQTRKWFKNKTDVQEVKHGYWIKNKKVCNSPYCSACGARGGGSYCHHCGAKMDLEEII